MLTTSVNSLLILGTDAVLAGAPATPVQLAHACRRAGYEMVVPSSWGDELIAARTLDRVGRSTGPLVQVSCPLAGRLLTPDADVIAPFLVCLVPPVVAVAEYLRTLSAPSRAHITFVGNCPAGAHPSIDAWLSPDELFAALGERGIRPTDEPTEFDSILPPDRRRFYSEPGGVPARARLQSLEPAGDVVELGSGDTAVELAQWLLSESRILINPAAGLGCACRGTAPGMSPAAAKARLVETEPPRALAPVVDHALPLVLDAPLPAPNPAATAERASRVSGDVVIASSSRRRTPGATQALEEGAPVAAETPRRRSPTSTRPVLGASPLARQEGAGRRLPRAYVARRRSSPRGMNRVNRAGGPRAPYATWIWIGLAGLASGLGLAWILGLGR